jgi:hypothetical protein
MQGPSLQLHQAHLASFPTKEDFDAYRAHKNTDLLAVSFAYIGLVQQRGGKRCLD